jgi:ribosomal protein S18 acetylase RimI-like enzyme
MRTLCFLWALALIGSVLALSGGVVPVMSTSAAVPAALPSQNIDILRIETETDIYTAASLSIDVFFNENLPTEGKDSLFDKLQAPFRKRARDKFTDTLFSRHLLELNSRLNKPNCLILKAVDEGGNIVGLCEMFMGACIIDRSTSSTDDGSGNGNDNGGDEFAVRALYDGVTIVGMASAVEREAAGPNILYYPKIANLAISPSARRQGLGSRLVQQCLDTAKQWDLPTVVLQVEKPNQSARDFYKAIGFTEVAVDTTTKAWQISNFELKLVPTPKYFMCYHIDGQ